MRHKRTAAHTAMAFGFKELQEPLSDLIPAQIFSAHPVAAAFTGVVGYVLGRLTLKLRGAYFVLVTVGFAEVIRLVATNWMDLTQGPMGLAGVPPFNLGTDRLTLVSKRDYYYLMAVMAGGTLYLTARLLGSRIGSLCPRVRRPHRREAARSDAGYSPVGGGPGERS